MNPRQMRELERQHEVVTYRVKKLYYHILEHGSYGQIGWQGYEETESEAKLRISTLNDMFPNSYFEIFQDTTKNEPPITTS